MTTHLVIPDTQIKPGVKLNHLQCLGEWVVHKQPDRIIMLGDWADMHSLSSYDTGTLKGEGVRYNEDIAAARNGMETLLRPLWKLQRKQRINKQKVYRPSMDLLLGNHENRINRYANSNPALSAHVSTDDLGYDDFGWRVHNFLEVIERDGILYSHYFPRNAQGRIVQTTRGSPNARLQVQREGQSSTSGHLQGLDWHVQQRRDRRDYGLIAGSFYMHEEDYLSPQGTAYWRGVILKNEVHDGNYDLVTISIDYLLRSFWNGSEIYA